MAVDLRIEVFSVDIFRNLWHKLGIKEFVIPRLKNYDEFPDQNVCSEAIIHAVLCRLFFFRDLLWGTVFFDYEEFSQSSIDFYLYLQNNVSKLLPYNEYNIFEKLLMICVIVLEMSCTCAHRGNSMFTYYAPICFASYFDIECKKEFYHKGGWGELEHNANRYEAKIFTHTYGEKVTLSARNLYNIAVNMEYSVDHIHKAFRYQVLNGKSNACLRCLPLFQVVKILSGTSDEVVPEFQLIEGYLQIVMRMLSQNELHHIEQAILQGTDYETIRELIDIEDSYTKAKQQGESDLLNEVSNEKCQKYVEEYRVRNTSAFLNRLFVIHDDSDDAGCRCMFCGRNVEEKDETCETFRDYQVERIKSAINDTLINVELKSDEFGEESFQADESKNDDISDVLKLFFSLGIEPVASSILRSIKTRNENRNIEISLDSSAKNQTKKSVDDEMKASTVKKKQKKKKQAKGNRDNR